MTAFRLRGASKAVQAVESGCFGPEPCRVPERPQHVGSPTTHLEGDEMLLHEAALTQGRLVEPF